MTKRDIARATERVIAIYLAELGYTDECDEGSYISYWNNKERKMVHWYRNGQCIVGEGYVDDPDANPDLETQIEELARATTDALTTINNNAY